MRTARAASWIALADVARELDLSVAWAIKDLRRVAWCYPPRAIKAGTRTRLVWDARVLDLLRAMRGQPHRTLEPAQTDWLATYLKENSSAPTSP